MDIKVKRAEFPICCAILDGKHLEACQISHMVCSFGWKAPAVLTSVISGVISVEVGDEAVDSVSSKWMSSD